MRISFKRRKMEKDFAEERKLVKTYGRQMADKVMLRMGVLKNAPNLAKVPTDKPERCHALAGDRNGQYSVDLVQPNRLIFEPDHDPVPKLEDGGTDKENIDAIKIAEICDPH